MTEILTAIHGEAVRLLAALWLRPWSEVLLKAALVAGVATFAVAGWRLLGEEDARRPRAAKPRREPA